MVLDFVLSYTYLQSMWVFEPFFCNVIWITGYIGLTNGEALEGAWQRVIGDHFRRMSVFHRACNPACVSCLR